MDFTVILNSKERDEATVKLEPNASFIKNSANISWQQDYDKRRIDVLIPNYSPRTNGYNAQNFRFATKNGIGFYHDLNQNSAYIENPSVIKLEHLHLLSNLDGFDLQYLYNFQRDLLDRLLRKHLNLMPGMTVNLEITTVKFKGLNCERIDYLSEHTGGEGDNTFKRGRKAHIILAIDQGYSIVEAELSSGESQPSDPNEIAYIVFRKYEASYRESDKYPGVWIYKTMHYQDKRSRNIEFSQPEEFQDIKFTFHNTDLNSNIPETAFTFEGLGVANDTLIADKRSDAVESHYLFQDGKFVPADGK